MTTMYNPDDYHHEPEDWENPCDGIGGYEEECKFLSGWHYKPDSDDYSMWDVCAVLVQTNGSTCNNYCEEQGRTCLYA